MRTIKAAAVVGAGFIALWAADIPAFEVASVKPSKPDTRPYTSFPLGPGDVYMANGGLFSASGVPLVTYIFFAYKLIGNQAQFLLPQLPDWAKTERFDIQARASGNPGKDDMRMMMRALLADRFKLSMHTEAREVPVFAWVLAKAGKLGPGLQPHADSAPCPSNTPPPGANAGQPKGPTVEAPLCNGVFGMPPSEPGRVRIFARNVAIGFLADSLSAGANMGRPMTDKTGLSGKYDITLEWTPDLPQATSPATGAQPELSGPTLQQALQDQLGIKLQSDKGPLDVYVLDHVERPSAN